MSKHPFDIPVKVYRPNEKKPQKTTLNTLLQPLKCALIVNVASRCGHTKKHYEQLVELRNKYNQQGFEVFAFPCNQFGGQEPKDVEQVC